MVHPSILHTQAFKFKKVQHVFVMFAGILSGKNVIKLFLDIHQKYVTHVLLKSQNGFVCPTTSI